MARLFASHPRWSICKPARGSFAREVWLPRYNATMCGRYVREATPDQVAEAFHAVLLSPQVDIKLATYNIAPSQPALVVRDHHGRREVAVLRWGLVPHWADDPSIGSRMINARAESVASKPAYRGAFRHHRCLVPATGFYEWANTAHGKQPYLIRMPDHPLFAFAGLWEHWQSPDGAELETFTIITTANPQVREIHDRMPAMLRPDQSAAWLDPKAKQEQLLAMLAPTTDRLDLVPVSRLVNTPRHDTPECVQPVNSHTDRATLWDAGH